MHFLPSLTTIYNKTTFDNEQLPTTICSCYTAKVPDFDSKKWYFVGKEVKNTICSGAGPKKIISRLLIDKRRCRGIIECISAILCRSCVVLKNSFRNIGPKVPNEAISSLDRVRTTRGTDLTGGKYTTTSFCLNQQCSLPFSSKTGKCRRYFWYFRDSFGDIYRTFTKIYPFFPSLTTQKEVSFGRKTGKNS